MTPETRRATRRAQRIDSTIDNLIGHLENLKVEMPAAKNALMARRARVDGWPAGNDNPKVAGGESSSSVERAVESRVDRIDDTLNALDHELNAAVLIVRNLRADCQRHANTPIDKPRCDTGAGREGWTIPRTDGGWHDPICENVPPPDRNTCDACRKRAERWSRARLTDVPSR